MSVSRRFFLQHAGLPVLACVSGGRLLGAKKEEGALPRGSAEAEGVDPQSILSFLRAVEEAGVELHSFMVVRHGRVIAEGWWEPYGPEFVHSMYSMSKSFTSTAIGFAVSERRLKVDDRVVSFFPDEVPWQVTENLGAMRVRDLLTMSAGNRKDPTQACVQSENWVRTFLAQPVDHRPGTQFLYNSAATYMCSAIVQRLTGQTVLEYLRPRLFEPLGIRGMRWETCPRGINTGGWGLSIQTEGLAKFGLLFLQKGKWNGAQILPEAWVDEATRFHIQQPGGDKPDRAKADNDWLQGYGYQFWRCRNGGFRGDGAFGQFTIVLPREEAVIVMTSENKNMQAQLDLVWRHLLPAFSTKPRPAVFPAFRTPLPEGGTATPPALAAKRTYRLDPNDLGIESISFEFTADRCRFTADAESIPCGFGTWLRSEASVPAAPPRLISGGRPPGTPKSKIAAAAAWAEDRTLTMTWRYYETPHRDTVTCVFDETEGTVALTFLNSIAAMNPSAKDSRRPLLGKLTA
ncbi:MAG: CubicO group peptidase, beta-lactamase class C family [Verrucomicrobia bacterium]|nr:MAG: CubicO group peptidase, beta-lactamase class C family [Verrucomicrobiota bacterium]